MWMKADQVRYINYKSHRYRVRTNDKGHLYIVIKNEHVRLGSIRGKYQTVGGVPKKTRGHVGGSSVPELKAALNNLYNACKKTVMVFSNTKWDILWVDNLCPSNRSCTFRRQRGTCQVTPHTGNENGIPPIGEEDDFFESYANEMIDAAVSLHTHDLEPYIFEIIVAGGEEYEALLQIEVDNKNSEDVLIYVAMNTPIDNYVSLRFENRNVVLQLAHALIDFKNMLVRVLEQQYVVEYDLNDDDALSQLMPRFIEEFGATESENADEFANEYAPRNLDGDTLKIVLDYDENAVRYIDTINIDAVNVKFNAGTTCMDFLTLNTPTIANALKDNDNADNFVFAAAHNGKLVQAAVYGRSHLLDLLRDASKNCFPCLTHDLFTPVNSNDRRRASDLNFKSIVTNVSLAGHNIFVERKYLISLLRRRDEQRVFVAHTPGLVPWLMSLDARMGYGASGLHCQDGSNGTVYELGIAC